MLINHEAAHYIPILFLIHPVIVENDLAPSPLGTIERSPANKTYRT